MKGKQLMGEYEFTILSYTMKLSKISPDATIYESMTLPDFVKYTKQ